MGFFELRLGFGVRNGAERAEIAARRKFCTPNSRVTNPALVLAATLIFMAAGPWMPPAFGQTYFLTGDTTIPNLGTIPYTGISNSVPVGTTATLFASNPSATNFAHPIQDGTGVTALTVYGPAPLTPLTLSVHNTFSGGTQVGYNPGVPQSGSLIIGSGGQIGDVSVLYGSSLTNQNGGTIGFGAGTGTAGNVNIDATSMFANGGAVNGTVSNSGTFTNNGTGTVAGLTTNSAAITNNYGQLNGGLNNSGIATNYSGGSIAGVTNAGTFDNQSNAIVTGGLTNNAGGVTTNEGNIASGVIVNGGTFTTTGTINRGTATNALTNFAAVNASGTINGPIQNNGGTFTVAAGNTLNGTSLTNGALVTDAGTLNLSGDLINNATGVIDVTGTGSLTAATFINSGTINYLAPGSSTTYTGNLINDSIINMWNGSPTDVTKVTGNYSGDGVLKVDINTFTGQSDQLVVGGTALNTNGTTLVSFDVLKNGFVVALPVVTTGGGTDATAFSGSIPSWGTISYSFVQDGNDWVVKSYLNNSFGPLADIGGALASISTVFQQPASSYVGDKSNAKTDELYCGTWARTDFDRLTVHSSSTVTASGASVAPLNTSQNINYSAIESGLDCGLLRVGGTGWNVHLGFMGGEVDGQVTQTDGLGYTDLHVPILGAYAFIRNDGFVFDLSVRRSFTDAQFTIAQAGLLKTPVDGLATTTAAYTAYTLEVQKNVLLMPYAGLSWTRSELNDFEIYTNVGGIPTGLVAPNTSEDSMGRLGFQLSYVQQLTDTFYLRPFAGISGWHAFENGTSLKYFVTNGTVVDVATPTPPDFMQVEGGLSFAENSIQATGYVKGVYKEGSDIKGEAIVLGGRLNF